ncbi:MAG: hypothetical protein K0R07_229 [Sedimentibacter sp.]|jgi:hypothetical protein|nr:hypothetical protein [Sedimentibacter sp.]
MSKEELKIEHSVFYEFYKNAGFKVYTSQSGEWCEIQHGMLMSIPYHRLISPSAGELDQLLKISGAWGVRFPIEMSNYGFLSKLEVCDHFGYDQNFLQHKFRNRVAKGEQNCEIKTVSIQELKNEGYSLNLRTLERQKRNDPKANEEYWHKICDGLAKTSGINIFGAYFQGRLAAYVVVLETPSMAEMIIQNSDTELLSYCPNNLLTYYVTWYYLTKRSNPIPVCYGLGSLEETPGLDRYKKGMGYVMQPIKQRLHFRKEIRLFLRPWLLFLGNLINKHVVKGKSYTLDKCCAMLKRYLEQQ